MFKILGKIFVIVTIAMIVAGGLYVLAQTDTGRAMLGVNQTQVASGERPTPPSGAMPTGQMPGGEHGAMSWTTGAAEMLRHLGLIGAMMLGVAAFQWTLGRASRRLQPNPLRARIRSR